MAVILYFMELIGIKGGQDTIVSVGGWFVGTIGTQKLLKYLENKGEGSGGNQPYESTR